MTNTPAPDAVQIVRDTINANRKKYVEDQAAAVVAALTRTGWLHDPADPTADELSIDLGHMTYERDEAAAEAVELRDQLAAARAEVAALRAVADAVRAVLVDMDRRMTSDPMPDDTTLAAALDTLSPAAAAARRALNASQSPAQPPAQTATPHRPRKAAHGPHSPQNKPSQP